MGVSLWGMRRVETGYPGSVGLLSAMGVEAQHGLQNFEGAGYRYRRALAELRMI